MNQPLGSCHSHTKEIASITDELQHYHYRKSQQERNPSNDPTTTSEPPDSNDMDVDYEEQVTSKATVFTEEYEGAGALFGNGTTFMNQFDLDTYASEHQENTYYPFASKDEWELASFLLGSDLSMAAITKFLSLKLVSFMNNSKVNS